MGSWSAVKAASILAASGETGPSCPKACAPFSPSPAIDAATTVGAPGTGGRADRPGHSGIRLVAGGADDCSGRFQVGPASAGLRTPAWSMATVYVPASAAPEQATSVAARQPAAIMRRSP